MSPKSKWLIALMTMLALTACGNVDDTDDDDTDDTDTTEETVDDTDEDVTEDDADGSTETGSPADFDSFSLSVSEAVVDGAFNTDGETIALTAHVGDRFNKAVDDDTIVYFWAENGILDVNYCYTSDGSCSVNWISGGTRPVDGLATILAYAVGEDSYIESGVANGIYNVASDVVGEGGVALGLDEAIISAPEAFKDYDFDWNYDDTTTTLEVYELDGSVTTVDVPEDAFLDYNGDGEYEESSSVFRGEDCSAAASTAGHCSETSIYVWDQTQIVWGPSFGGAITDVSASYTTDFDSVTAVADWDIGDTIYVLVSDYKGNTPVAGTSISVATDSDTDEDFTVGYSAEAVPTLGTAYGYPYVFALTLSNAVEGAGTAEITVTYNGSDYLLYVDY